MTNDAEPLAITVRFEGDLSSRLRKHQERLAKIAPGDSVTLAHTIRNLVLKGLSEVERAR